MTVASTDSRRRPAGGRAAARTVEMDVSGDITLKTPAQTPAGSDAWRFTQLRHGV